MQHLFQQLLTTRFKHQSLLYVPQGLTFTNSTFYPQSVFVCFVWISQQTAIPTLYSVNRLVLITETESVFCAVRTESLNVLTVIQLLKFFLLAHRNTRSFKTLLTKLIHPCVGSLRVLYQITNPV